MEKMIARLQEIKDELYIPPGVDSSCLLVHVAASQLKDARVLIDSTMSLLAASVTNREN